MSSESEWPAAATVVPVVTLHDARSAVALVDALASGGICVVEVTLRTPAALDAVRRIREQAPDVWCGVGTVRAPDDVDRAVDAGAQFLVSPGSTARLLARLRESGLPCLPGAFTVSEAIGLVDAGFRTGKLYPGGLTDGRAALAAMAGPLPELGWCVTGGVTMESAPQLLCLPNVAAVGGSWMAPEAVVANRDWETVRSLTAATVRHLGEAPRLRPV